MIILHPYTGLRPDDEKETWDFLHNLRGTYTIIDRKMGVENGFPRTAYVDLMKEFWGTDDLIVIEDDKVPTLEDFQELVACQEMACCFPYSMLGLGECDMNYWREFHPNTLGFVKFSKEVQLKLPPEEWGPPIDKPFYPFAPVDKMIEDPLTAKFGPMHLHEHPIIHNHPPRRER